MAEKVLALLLLATLVPQHCCQHWSYGLSPGGKRELDSISDTLDNIVGGFPHMERPCSVLGSEEESPFANIYRLKGFLDGVADREKRHKSYKK